MISAKKAVLSCAMVVCTATVGAEANTLIPTANNDFEAFGGTLAGVNYPEVVDWNQELYNGVDNGPEYIFVGGTEWTPQASNTLYFAGSGAVNQDLNHNWSSSDVFTLAFDAYEAGWRVGAEGDAIVAQLRQADDTVLWDSGSLSLDETVSGSRNNFAFAGTEHQFSFVVDAATFAGVAGALEGSQLNLRFEQGGGSPLVDDVSLTYVPEPTSLALIGMGGLLLLRRR